MDPFESKMWPSYFDPHSVEEIAITPLHELPKLIKVQSVADFI